jgi:hypothetical protein
MPKTIRDLKNILLIEPGSSYFSSKNHHSIWFHPLLSDIVILSGDDENNAKPYQIKDIKNILQKLAVIKQKQQKSRHELPLRYTNPVV